MAYNPRPYRGELTLEGLQRHFDEELNIIARQFAETTELELRPINAAPDKPREGMIVYADGTHWNPGAGKGVYVRLAATWSKL